MPRQTITAEPTHVGQGWTLTRIVCRREPLLGVLLCNHKTQKLFVETGAVVVGPAHGLQVLGAGHTVELKAEQRFLLLPMGLVVWRLAWEVGAVGMPSATVEPARTRPITLPAADPPPGLIPDALTPWLSLPTDVATWASLLDVHSTSLAQRCKRLTGTSPKTMLGAIRASVALNHSEEFQGKGRRLADAAGYASHTHLSTDLHARLGTTLQAMNTDQRKEQLDWLRLMRSVFG